MKRLLIHLAIWVLHQFDAMPVPREVVHYKDVIHYKDPPWYTSVQPYLETTSKLITAAEANSAEGTSGEYKRHQVYATLIKLFPKANHRHLGLAIEVAVNRRE